jgi:hypothetical protein
MSAEPITVTHHDDGVSELHLGGPPGPVFALRIEDVLQEIHKFLGIPDNDPRVTVCHPSV